MSMHSVETKRAIELQHAASDAYRLARDAHDADPTRAPSVAALQQAAAHAYAEAARARVEATGI